MPEEKTYKRSPLTEEHKEKIRQAHIGRKFTEEHKEKISRSHIGIKRTDEWRANQSKAKDKYKKPLIQYDLDGKEVARYSSMTEAAEALGIQKARLSSCLAGRSRTAAGYRWAEAEKEN